MRVRVSPGAPTYNMTRRKPHVDPREYIRVRIAQLTEERAKNHDETAHMVLDKSIHELSIVLELLERKAPLLASR